MSNKPKIFATCKAGCLWETVHRDEFLASASHIKQNIGEDGLCYLELGKEYKIFADKTADGLFSCLPVIKFNQGGTTVTHTFVNSNVDQYADSYVFKLLDVIIPADLTQITFIYEMAGIRYSETLEGQSFSAQAREDLYVSGATKVLMYNADATIIGDVGEQGEAINLKNYSPNYASLVQKVKTSTTNEFIISNDTFKGNGDVVYTINWSDMTVSWGDGESSKIIAYEDHYIFAGSGSGNGVYKISNDKTTASWSKENIALYNESAAFGDNVKVLSDNAFGVGYHNVIEETADSAFVAGEYNKVAGTSGATATGYKNYVKGTVGFAGNGNNQVLADYGTAFGNGNVVKGVNAYVIGEKNKANTWLSFVGGYYSEANHSGATVIGNRLRSARVWQAVFGEYNDYENDKNAMLVVGRGTSETDRKTIFKVTEDGTVIGGKSTEETDSDFTLTTKGYVKDLTTNLVDITSQQTITGQKTLTKELIINGDEKSSTMEGACGKLSVNGLMGSVYIEPDDMGREAITIQDADGTVVYTGSSIIVNGNEFSLPTEGSALATIEDCESNIMDTEDFVLKSGNTSLVDGVFNFETKDDYEQFEIKGSLGSTNISREGFYVEDSCGNTQYGINNISSKADGNYYGDSIRHTYYFPQADGTIALEETIKKYYSHTITFSTNDSDGNSTPLHYIIRLTNSSPNSINTLELLQQEIETAEAFTYYDCIEGDARSILAPKVRTFFIVEEGYTNSFREAGFYVYTDRKWENENFNIVETDINTPTRLIINGTIFDKIKEL